ncbi:MAG: CvpA family protein [Caulobacterales bacterium]
MDNLHMTYFDLVVIAVIVISAAMSLVRGFMREAFSIAAFVGAAFATILGFPHIRPLAEKQFGVGLTADAVTLAGIFLIVYVLIAVIAGQLTKVIRQVEEVNLADRLLGLVFGAARGLLLLALFSIVIEAALPADRLPKVIAKAATYPFVRSTARWIQSVVPAKKIVDQANKLDGPVTTESRN